MSNSHVVQTLPVLLIEFPHYCIIALKMALGYVCVCCVNVYFIILADPLAVHLHLQPPVPKAPPLTVFQPVSAV